MDRRISQFFFIFLTLLAVSGAPGSPATARATEVEFDVDANAEVAPISPYIYGVNQFHGVLDGLGGPYANCPFTRLGGNRLTAYNWTNNASNAGSDYHFINDDYLVNGPMFDSVRTLPGGANIPVIQLAAQRKAGVLLTIPINGYVSADLNGDDVRQSGPDFLARRFVLEEPRKGAPFTLQPDPSARVVYEDEFVNWVKTEFPYCEMDPNRPIWFNLDNEPDWWYQTHPEIHPKHVTYAELLQKSIAYASAAKAVMPNTLIFGAANYGWHGYQTLQDAPDAEGRDFLDFYLRQMAGQQKKTGVRLLDVMDVHWYPEAKGDGTRIIYGPPSPKLAVKIARAEAPRSLWDPTYSEDSWIAKDSLHEPIRLIPRLKEKIAEYYPGTKLSISEYSYGGGTDISGGIAEADVLGVFGREGLFAAALWPGRDIPFIGGAFEMYRDFDGQGGTFGDLSVKATTTDIQSSSIYASLDSHDRYKMALVLINKTDAPLPAEINLLNMQSGLRISDSAVYQLTETSPHPRPAGKLEAGPGDTFKYVMPAFSVSTVKLTLERQP
jgi:hypothetical protein